MAHNEFKGKNIRELLKNYKQGVIYDVKSILPIDQIDSRL